MAPNNNNSTKNNKKKRNKNKKASDGGSGGGGTGDNNNHNHNNSTIPTLATAAAVKTTSLLTREQLDHYDEAFGLKGYPKSTYFAIGIDYFFKVGNIDLAIASFIRGAENDGCVGCIYLYIYLQIKCNNFHVVVPWALEGAIRGHLRCMKLSIHCYNQSKPVIACALLSFWLKLMNELGDTIINEETRKEHKKNISNGCYVCQKEDSNDKTFKKCGMCKYYSYCGKDCQTYHWKEQNHMAECRQLKILHTCCKPHHVREIREAIISGVDPKDIPRLQNLRMDLGLNRPKEEYEELLLRLNDDNDSTIQDRYTYLIARKDGTVHIGSTSEAI